MTVLDRPVERAPVSKARDWRFLGRSADFWICATLTLIVAARPGVEHRRLPDGVRRRGHLPRAGLGDRPRHRHGAVHLLVRPPAARLDPAVRARLDTVTDLPRTRAARGGLQPDHHAAVHRGLLDPRLRARPPDEAAPLVGGARGRAVRALPAVGHPAARDLPGQRRGHLDPRGLRARVLPAQAPVAPRRLRALRRGRGAVEGDHAPRRPGADRRAVAERAQGHEEVLLRRLHRRVHPDRRPVPAVRDAQGRALRQPTTGCPCGRA